MPATEFPFSPENIKTLIRLSAVKMKLHLTHDPTLASYRKALTLSFLALEHLDLPKQLEQPIAMGLVGLPPEMAEILPEHEEMVYGVTLALDSYREHVDTLARLRRSLPASVTSTH